MKPLHIGAEAVLYKQGNKLIKERVRKDYRIKELDEPIRKRRTRREAKVLQKADCNIPKLIKVDDQNMIIEMDYIDGDVLKNILDNDKKEVCENFAKQIALLHNQNIIHGDLTTSNAILKKDQVYLIDFGLSFFSHKLEDKAVDLRLLKQALESKHYKNYKQLEKWILETYKEQASDANEVIERLKKVEKRGRYKRKKKKKNSA